MINEIIYTGKTDKKVVFKGRLVGVINDKEAQAILNTKHAPRAVFTSASLNPKNNYTGTAGKRLVFATTTLKKNRRVLLITPEISFISFRFMDGKDSVCFHTVNHEEYAIIVGNYKEC